jgi:hypothetical protein
MQVPINVCPSTFQHIAPASQLSTPLTPFPSTVQGSPGLAGFGSIGEHLSAFHEPPPSFAHGMHL